MAWCILLTKCCLSESAQHMMNNTLREKTRIEANTLLFPTLFYTCLTRLFGGLGVDLGGGFVGTGVVWEVGRYFLA